MAGVSLRPKRPEARRDEGAYPQRSVTEEQRSPRPFSAQPFGPQFFSSPAALLAPYRPLTGTRLRRAATAWQVLACRAGAKRRRVARALRETKIRCGETPAI